MSRAAWLCFLKMSEVAWLRPTKCPRPPGSVLQNVRGCLAPSSEMSEAVWLRPQFQTSQFPWQPFGFLKFWLSEVALQPEDLYCTCAKSPSRNREGDSAQTFSVSEDAWLRLLSNYSKILDCRYFFLCVRSVLEILSQHCNNVNKI